MHKINENSNMAVIYHNPRCSKSRQTLEILREHNVETNVILYMETRIEQATLLSLLKMLGITPRQLIRRNEADFKRLHLDNGNKTDEDLVNAMIEHPKLIERPIVVHNNKAVIGRPPENIHEIL